MAYETFFWTSSWMNAHPTFTFMSSGGDFYISGSFIVKGMPWQIIIVYLYWSVFTLTAGDLAKENATWIRLRQNW